MLLKLTHFSKPSSANEHVRRCSSSAKLAVLVARGLFWEALISHYSGWVWETISLTAINIPLCLLHLNIVWILFSDATAPADAEWVVVNSMKIYLLVLFFCCPKALLGNVNNTVSMWTVTLACFVLMFQWTTDAWWCNNVTWFNDTHWH